MRPILPTAALALAAAAAAAPASAATPIARGKVDFAFTVGDSVLPPGHYEFLKTDDPDNALMVRNRDTGQSIFALAIEQPRVVPRHGDKSELVFEEFRGDHVLARIDEQGGESLVLRGPALRKLEAEARRSSRATG